MSRNIDPLEEVVDRTDVLTYSYGDIAKDEKRKIEQLIWVKSQLMMWVISKHKISAVVELYVP